MNKLPSVGFYDCLPKFKWSLLDRVRLWFVRSEISYDPATGHGIIWKRYKGVMHVVGEIKQHAKIAA